MKTFKVATLGVSLFLWNILGEKRRKISTKGDFKLVNRDKQPKKYNYTTINRTALGSMLMVAW